MGSSFPTGWISASSALQTGLILASSVPTSAASFPTTFFWALIPFSCDHADFIGSRVRNVLSCSPAVIPFSSLPHTLDRVLLVLLSSKAFPGPPHSKLGIDSLRLLTAHLEKAFLIIYILLTSLFALPRSQGSQVSMCVARGSASLLSSHGRGTNGGSLWLWCCLPQPGALGP